MAGSLFYKHKKWRNNQLIVWNPFPFLPVGQISLSEHHISQITEVSDFMQNKLAQCFIDIERPTIGAVVGMPNSEEDARANDTRWIRFYQKMEASINWFKEKIGWCCMNKNGLGTNWSLQFQLQMWIARKAHFRDILEVFWQSKYRGKNMG